MADYIPPDQRRRMGNALMAAQYAENPPAAPMGYDFDAAPLSPGLMNFAAQRGQPGVIQKTLGVIPGFDQDGKRAAQSWGNALMSTAQFPIDAVAGIGQAITAPARAYRGEFDPVSEEGVGEALNVAGNAMMGGLAAPKPRTSSTTVRPTEIIERGYHGSRSNSLITEPRTDSGPWGSSSHDIANSYALTNNPLLDPIVAPVEYRFKNPAVYDAGGSDWMSVPTSRDARKTTDQIAADARANGRDGVVIRQVKDSLTGNTNVNATAGDVYIPLQPGTTYSALTGDLLYANGGRPGAATGAALGAIPDTPGIRAYHGTTAKPFDTFSDPPFLTKDPNIAAIYAAGEVEPANYVTFPWQRHARIIPAELRAKNMLEFDHINMPNVAKNLGIADPAVTMTDMIAGANANGYDALAMKINDLGGEQTQYIPTRRGTVYSPTTGDLLYANGGRPGAATGAALGAIPDTPGIRAYHGSPHDFDRFDMSKIGTGEGAQAYGHGLYFAENEGVAKTYREPNTPYANQMTDTPRQMAHDALAAAGGDAAKAKAELQRKANRMGSSSGSWLADMTGGAEAAKVKEALAKFDEYSTQPVNGRMYEVNIKANPDDFLDWDKPLSQQSEHIRKSMTDLANGEILPDWNGMQAYRSVGSQMMSNLDLMSPELSQRVREAGIPGVKYLDQGSRTGLGEGTSNYVVFDDNLIEILRKYGLLGMAGGAAAAEYGGNSLIPSRPASPQYRPGDA